MDISYGELRQGMEFTATGKAARRYRIEELGRDTCVVKALSGKSHKVSCATDLVLKLINSQAKKEGA